MSLDLATMRKPVTRVDWPDDEDAAEFNVSGNAVAPTAITDANVYPIPLVQRGVDAGDPDPNLQEVEETWQFQFRTDDPDSEAQVILWFYNQWLDKWYSSALIEVRGTNKIDLAHGGVFTMNGILGCSHVGVQVSNHAGQELYLAHMWS